MIVSCSWEMLIGIHFSLPGEIQKGPRPASSMSVVKQTPSGCGLIGFSGDAMYTFQVFNIRDGPIQLMAPVIVHLVEYVMYLGYDWWDILLIIGQGGQRTLFLPDFFDNMWVRKVRFDDDLNIFLV